MTIVTDERCTGYSSAGHPERPARVSQTLIGLREQKELLLQWASPLSPTEEQIGRAHAAAHIAAVKAAVSDFDGDTPAHPNIYDHARRSVGASLKAMQLARDNKPAFSLMRPPGHHATRTRAMGFCYFNSIAIAVLDALANGLERVAVFDFDVHHGNGTEAILLDHPGTTFCSVHQWPCYPGTGTKDVGKNCFNYPVPPETSRLAYRDILSNALERVVKTKPQLLAVSAGFDCYARDPLAQETLEVEDFEWLGTQLRSTGIPFFSVLEGGYSDDLPGLILAYLKGVAETK